MTMADWQFQSPRLPRLAVKYTTSSESLASRQRSMVTVGQAEAEGDRDWGRGVLSIIGGTDQALLKSNLTFRPLCISVIRDLTSIP